MRTLTRLHAKTATLTWRAMVMGAMVQIALASGCEDPAMPVFDGGAGLRLVVLDPPGAQIGLRYGKSVDLLIRYVHDDAQATPVANAPVRFAIFDDPVGSTLSRDTVQTDETGLATVTLTAGNQEGAFRVRASAGGADDVELAISISELEFVEIDAHLADPLPTPGTRSLVAALFVDKTCASLSPSPKLMGESRSLSQTSAATTTLFFVNLLSRTYALVGRVESGGRLLAYGCVDLERSLVPPGAHLSVPLALAPVRPRVTGDFDVDSELGSSRAARTDSLFADIDVLDRCGSHLGQLLLDELAARVSPTRASQISALRGAPQPSTSGSSTVSCRPSMVGASSSLDADLDALLSASGSPGEQRAALLADLDAVLQSARLRSRLSLQRVAQAVDDAASAADRYAASHHGVELSFTLGSETYTDSLAAEGTPVTGADEVPATADDVTLAIEPHLLPIGLQQAWGMAMAMLSIAPRFPTLTEPTFGGWASAAVSAAMHNGDTGCAAIEDLLCEATDPSGCTGTLLSACADAVTAVATRLDAPFAGSAPLSLGGGATIVDVDGDLFADKLEPGQWSATEVLSGLYSFQAVRTP